nr:uncharacterized protein CTRU02_11025 [Colletotrichum truncatum]KAF6786527.1 hypothetical protein CTRU02_11025 [Colletotrichum truncatum]
MSGFAIVPLASNATLWSAQTIEQWQAEFSVCYEERTIYGLSETGQLMKLQQDSTGIQSSMAKWEDWSAAVGELGSLVTIAGTLLENSFPNVP